MAMQPAANSLKPHLSRQVSSMSDMAVSFTISATLGGTVGAATNKP